MKQNLFCLVAVALALFLCACKPTEKPETVLFRDFNLAAIVEQLKVTQLKPETGGGGGSTAIGETTERRHNFDLEYSLDERNNQPFDEAIFLNKLKSKIAEAIDANNVRTNGSGSGNDSFYFNYSKDENKGSIEVIGARVEDNKYRLWCVMRESAGVETSR